MKLGKNKLLKTLGICSGCVILGYFLMVCHLLFDKQVEDNEFYNIDVSNMGEDENREYVFDPRDYDYLDKTKENENTGTETGAEVVAKGSG
jgi:hypothetical protein